MAFPKLGCCLKNQELYSQQTVKYFHVCRNTKIFFSYLGMLTKYDDTENITKPSFISLYSRAAG